MICESRNLLLKSMPRLAVMVGWQKNCPITATSLCRTNGHALGRWRGRPRAYVVLVRAFFVRLDGRDGVTDEMHCGLQTDDDALLYFA